MTHGVFTPLVVTCSALPHNELLLIIREPLLGLYIIANGSLARRSGRSGRALTPAFIPSFLQDEGHSLYLQNDFPPLSFMPALLPSSTPGHESENLTPPVRAGRERHRYHVKCGMDTLRPEEPAEM